MVGSVMDGHIYPHPEIVCGLLKINYLYLYSVLCTSTLFPFCATRRVCYACTCTVLHMTCLYAYSVFMLSAVLLCTVCTYFAILPFMAL